MAFWACEVPFRSVCGDEPVCALLKFSFFVIFPFRSPIFPLFSLPFSFSLFPQLSSNFPAVVLHFLTLSAFSFVFFFFGQSDASPRNPLSAMCSTRHRILRRTRHVVKEDFACFSAFLGTFKKKVLIT